MSDLLGLPWPDRFFLGQCHWPGGAHRDLYGSWRDEGGTLYLGTADAYSTGRICGHSGDRTDPTGGMAQHDGDHAGHRCDLSERCGAGDLPFVHG